LDSGHTPAELHTNPIFNDPVKELMSATEERKKKKPESITPMIVPWPMLLCVNRFCGE
jgi:hypothetical protein